jgi:hypothetical protein
MQRIGVGIDCCFLSVFMRCSTLQVISIQSLELLAAQNVLRTIKRARLCPGPCTWAVSLCSGVVFRCNAISKRSSDAEIAEHHYLQCIVKSDFYQQSLTRTRLLSVTQCLLVEQWTQRPHPCPAPGDAQLLACLGLCEYRGPSFQTSRDLK